MKGKNGRGTSWRFCFFILHTYSISYNFNVKPLYRQLELSSTSARDFFSFLFKRDSSTFYFVFFFCYSLTLPNISTLIFKVLKHNLNTFWQQQHAPVACQITCGGVLNFFGSNYMMLTFQLRLELTT